MNSAPWVTMKLVPRPWWMRFFWGLELAIFGSVQMEGQIRDLQEKSVE